jgi:transcriptional regulator with XRE-family HTH domain
MADLSALLSAYRQRVGLTQEQLSERSGVSVRAISDIEGGRVRSPHRRTRQALVAALGASPREYALFLRAARPRRAGGTGAPWRPSAPMPLGLADFAARTGEIAALTELASGRGEVAVLHGAPGTGKTSTAIHFAQLAADRFPDGRIFVSVGDRADVGALLMGMGVSRAAVPRDARERSAMQRAMVAGKRLLLILDDVVSLEQAEAAPAGEPGLLTVITSRRALSAPAGASMIKLDVLPQPDALQLLASIVGPDRVASDAAAAREVVQLCDRLPLAVRAAGNRLASRPGWPIGHLAAQLRDRRRRLCVLMMADERIGSSLETACRRLGPDAAQTFWRLGTSPAVGDLAPSEEVLRELVDAGLLETDGQGGYTMLGLIRSFAGQHARPGLPENGRR